MTFRGQRSNLRNVEVEYLENGTRWRDGVHKSQIWSHIHGLSNSMKFFDPRWLFEVKGRRSGRGVGAKIFNGCRKLLCSSTRSCVGHLECVRGWPDLECEISEVGILGPFALQTLAVNASHCTLLPATLGNETEAVHGSLEKNIVEKGTPDWEAIMCSYSEREAARPSNKTRDANTCNIIKMPENRPFTNAIALRTKLSHIFR